MKDIIPAKKESPLLGLTGLGGGVGSNLGGSLAEKTYVDEVFSTQVYIGNGAARTINNGIDLDGEGGLVWTKARSLGWWGPMVDTVRGKDYTLTSSSDQGQGQYATTSGNEGITSFNSNGYSLGADGSTGVFNYSSSQTYASWTFRKKKGFFDIVTFQQSGADSQTTPQVVPHNLGVAPGMILLKRINGDRDWFVYHRELGKDYWMKLNESGAAVNENNSWGTTEPDANNFGYMSGYIGGGGASAQYIAYLFAGGESTAATARSVDFDGVGDALVSNTSTDYVIGTNDFTLEFWINMKDNFNGNQVILDQNKSSNNATTPFQIYGAGQSIRFYVTGDHITKTIVSRQWNHVAIVRSSGTTTMYFNGTSVGTYSDSNNYDSNQITMGASGGNTATQNMSAWLSNVRLVVGTAVYTSSFRPPTEPLTNITNTKFLACQNSTTTGTTVGTIQAADGNPTATTYSPFDDPEGFKFGEESDQNLVKCGRYIGNGNATTGTRVNLGFEPQWVVIKPTSYSEHWHQFDNMRGMINGGIDSRLELNLSGGETNTVDFIDINSDGFTALHNPNVNSNNQSYIYMAIRRPDGLVGKPVEAGTDVFNIDFGNGSSTGPALDSNFAVDMLIKRAYESTSDWGIHFRLTGPKDLRTNTTDVEGNAVNPGKFDYMNGVSINQSTSIWGLMWKRHAGLDVVNHDGNGTAGKQIPHSLGKVPQMIWTKKRNGTEDWVVYNEFLNGGTNPANYYLSLNLTHEQSESSIYWNNTVPTSTHFTVGGSNRVNNSSGEYISMLFASVEGVSKVGSYVGNSGTISITTGFQPRFLIIKNTTWTYGGWIVFDTLRGLGAGNDKYMYLNTNAAQATNQDFGDISSTGFSMGSGDMAVNANNHNFIYYAHA